MNVRIESTWKENLKEEFEKPYFKQLTDFIRAEYENRKGRVFPLPNEIFKAFNLCPFELVKVVILGQDPYPTRGHANGLCFSVKEDVYPFPRSLNNLFKELKDDLGIQREHGSLESWSRQGVLLLNSVLTVEEGKPASHTGKGWEQFTDAVLKILSSKKEHIVFVLWGNWAQQKKPLINELNHLIIQSPHPSPLSAHRGFFGSRPFGKINAYLLQSGHDEIKW
jgi:uracil-DNA glycosylase